MKNNILTPTEIENLYNLYELNLSNIIKSKYFSTFDFIDKNFCYVKLTNSNNKGKNKFTEKLYQYVTGIKGICKQCKNNPTTFRSFSKGYFDFCSQKCQQLNTASKYGVKNLFQSNEIKEKIKLSLIKKYGVDHPNKSIIIQNKTKRTKKEKYGNENYNNMEKTTQTMVKRYGVRSPSQMEGYLEKWTKSGVKRKSYILPSGKEIKVQGYENKALDIMLKKYSESEIFECNPPKIKYNENEINRIFYPDFYIKKNNLIIEIKSRFTFDKWKNKNLLKIDECKNQGFDIEYWIINKKGNIEEII